MDSYEKSKKLLIILLSSEVVMLQGIGLNSCLIFAHEFT